MTPEQRQAYDEALLQIEDCGRAGFNILNLNASDLAFLPPEIGRLTKLEILNLADNQLVTLPPEICQLTSLLGLILSDNQLNALPPEIGQLTKLTQLDLSSNQLSVLPPEIGQLSALTQLDLRSNQLRVLSPEIGKLTALTKLHLASNQLSALPQEVEQLTALTWLDLSANQLNTLPQQIGQLTALTWLDLGANQLNALPPEIGQLIALTHLDLSTNRLSFLPPEIGQLTALTRLTLRSNQLSALPPEIGQPTTLTHLCFGSNQLNALPPEIGQLTALTWLDLSSNQLSALPPEIGQLTALTQLFLDANQLSALPPEIGQLTGLTALYLSSNQLSALPPEIGQLTALTALSLASNQLSALPPEIRQLTALAGVWPPKRFSPNIDQYAALTELYLHNNPALGIPEVVLGPRRRDVQVEDKSPERPQDILGFYFSQILGKAEGSLRRVNELKVMLVGQGGAGKTSFRRFFMGEEHDRDEKETPGIALGSFPLQMAGEEITMRLWDFAGQEITHAMHRFFLAEGCIYILVVDPRSDAEEENAKYWLGLLNRYAKGAPVLIAMNQQDAREGGYDLPRRELKAAFRSIWSFTRTNCETRENCRALLEELQNAVRALDNTEPPHLQVPGKWLDVMNACDNERFRKKPHLSLEEFRNICEKHGERDTAEQERLARVLHKLGAVLHFVDEPRLRDTAVLDPHWVTDGVYRLLRFKDGPGSDGALTIIEAKKALPGKTETDVRYLLRLMERFEMCFPLDEDPEKPGSKWLIPGALEKFQPETVGEEWQTVGAVRMRYIYDPLPEGVLPRFIVMTHLLSEGEPRWRNGVVLREGQSAALVRRGLRRNQVEITAFGPDAERLRLMEVIQGNLERIHRDLPDPKPVAEIELAGAPGVYRRLADMEAAERQKVSMAVKVEETGVELGIDPRVILNRTSDEESRTGDRQPLNAFLSYSHKDKSAKTIFGDNLAVMTTKRLISTWEDGLIEPGSLWREAIDDALERMDVFVGLLTTAFLASEFIQTVELAAARERLAKHDRSFLFILILVDDISLNGLDLSEYQIVKPGGKAVSQHPSRKVGFNAAQKEIEESILKQQEKRKESRRGWRMPPERVPASAEGVTIIVQGDYHHRLKIMKDDHSTHIGGNVTNSQVGQTLTNCTNMIHQLAPGVRKELLEELDKQVRVLISALPEEKKDEIPEIEENLEMVIKQATSERPNRRWYEVSAEGLLEASGYVKDFTENIAGTLGTLGKLVLGDA